MLRAVSDPTASTATTAELPLFAFGFRAMPRPDLAPGAYLVVPAGRPVQETSYLSVREARSWLANRGLRYSPQHIRNIFGKNARVQRRRRAKVWIPMNRLKEHMGL